MTVPVGRKSTFPMFYFCAAPETTKSIREIRPRGAFNIPRSGPVISVGAPHSNQFLDPLLLSLEVYKETHRHVQFLMAAKSKKRKAVGFFMRIIKCRVPIFAFSILSLLPGTGKLRISPDDPCLVLGDGTRFLSELSPRMQTMLPKSVNSLVAEAAEIISDTELKVKREFGGEKGTAKARDKIAELEATGEKGGLPFKKLPFVDQQEMYRYVYECLQNNGSIDIFPEGGSHNRTDLLLLKAGVSIMALGAMANNPNVRVKIVFVEFGGALDVPEELVEMFKQGGTQKREAVAKFLDLVYDALKTVTVRAPDYDTLMVVKLNRQLLEGYTHFKDEPRVVKLRKDVLKYNRLLRDLGLRDHQVSSKPNWATLGLLGYRAVLLLVWSVLALPGTILNGPMFIIASVLSRKKAKEALAESVVKIAARDVIATWKVLISLGVAPLLHATPFIVILSLPFMNFAALKFGEAGMDVLKSLRPLIVALVPGQQRSLDKLKAMRTQLLNEVVDVINDFGPKLYEDFNETRMLPTSSVPSSSGKPGLWRRTSSTGAADAQGLGLIHPMTWIDERPFGWSRRGTSAWSGGDEISRVGTPEYSDEEDAGDYDNVLGYLPGQDDPSNPGYKARSRTNSYADLQRMRLSPLQPMAAPPKLYQNEATSPSSPTTELDGIHFRRGHRNRKSSLSDGVPVERIASVDRGESFNAATNHLNDEIRQKKEGGSEHHE
ncbi:hypothetical protein ARMGADRAFT_1132289 [Armillaria gallica]|uniref:Phospholipid/glycerol acyltransferase domain-containing protein n=1 Tax=Armillaria gallica TaxID=47427 RepID=A0A2H3CS68_ARMGA|nr:hypothetical protein ARMGADRAFT_1132289 [Armillaria gallica]